MGNPQRITLLSPGSIKGFVSARSPLALPSGFVAELNDVRLEDGAIRIRDGGVVIQGSIAGLDSLRGVFECVQNGVPTIFWAGRDAGLTSVYKSVDAGMAWTLVSPASGPYGDTRFASEGWVRFALVSQGGTDYVAMQNGVDLPRLYDGTNTTLVLATPIAPGVRFGARLDVGADFTTSPAPTNSAATHLQGTIKVQAGDYYLSLDVKPGVVAADTVVVSFPSFVMGTEDQRQFVWLVTDSTETFRGVKIEAAATTAGPWTTVYDPSTSSLLAVEGTSGNFLAGVDATPILGATIGAFRLSYQGDAPASTVTIQFLAMRESGLVPGGTNFGAAFSSTTSPSVGPGTVGVFSTAEAYAGVSIPISSLFGYEYALRVRGLPDTRFNRVSFYRNDIGTTGYYFFQQSPYAGPFTGYFVNSMADVDFTKPLPRADAISLPIGTGMESVNGRLFVCSGNRLYYSQAGDPFAFATSVSFSGGQADPDSAGSFQKPGETFQTVVGIGQVITGPESTGNPLSGAVSLYALTDRKTYVMSGYDALSLNKTTAICIGTRSPYSVARSNGGFYFLDSERQVRRVEGAQSAVLSKNVVDDRTKGIPDALIAVVWGCFLDGRYRMGYARPGDTQNTRILVFSETLGGFESIDRPFSPPPSALLPYYDASLSRYRLFGFGATSMVELDVPGATLDAGPADIVGRIVFPELSGATKDSGTLNLTFGAAWLVADAVANGTATLSVLGSASRVGPTVYPPMKLDPRATGAAKVATTTVTNTGAQTLTAQPALEIAALGGTRVYRFEIDAHPGSEAAQR